jgi:hypothetical protein
VTNYASPEVNSVKITRHINDATTGTLDVPEFQRDFVWTKNQVKDLLDSLIKGYPVGSFLVWDLSKYTTGKYVYEGKAKDWIVDGQQRLVSLCILSRTKPYWMDTNVWNDLIDKYRTRINIFDLESSLEYPAIKNDPKWIYPHEILSMPGDDDSRFADDLAKRLSQPGLFTKIYDNIKHIRSTFDGNIPVVRVSTSLENIATIFQRINSAGTRVKLADVTLAYIAAYNEGWIRANFIPYLEALQNEGFYFEPTLVIRALTAVGENKAVLKDVSEGFLRNTGALDNAFEKLKTSLNYLVQEFRNIGILSSALIYAKNTVIPITYLRSIFENEFQFNKALHFFLLALAQGRYSGSAETTLQEDVNKVHSSSSFNAAISALHNSLQPPESDPITIKEAVYYQGEGRFFKLILYLIAFENQASDWFSKIRLGYLPQNEINRDFTIEAHHFFPQSLLKRVGIEQKERDSIANIVFINPGTNKRLHDEPRLYIERFGIPTDELQKQLLPVYNPDLFRLENYHDFIETRSSMLSQAVRAYTQDLFPEFYDVTKAA